ncbi:N-acetylmuramoyl-L-alanine amidase [Luteimonas sp. MJ246]|uniref:N-acetylmuramoyl-L-alanine amidase n=1 Tax=Luteimonas sp. MJ174 TaxID=3129237 RepID=UPI0031BA198C
MLRVTAVLACMLLLVSCAHQPARNPIAHWVPSPNHDERRPVVIVLHYTEQDSVEQSLRTLSTRNSGGPVSSHYLVGDDGAIYQLVADSRRAWHAGGGRWGTITDLNSASIGIEIDNDGREPFTEPQVQALLRLLEDLTTRLRIPRSQVIGHSDLAPSRKIDPGALFPWKRLAAAGFGIWPADDAPPAPDGFDAMRALRLVGYAVDDPAAAIRAFRLRFRGDALTTLDEEDLRILHALTRPEGAGLLVPAP